MFAIAPGLVLNDGAALAQQLYRVHSSSPYTIFSDLAALAQIQMQQLYPFSVSSRQQKTRRVPIGRSSCCVSGIPYPPPACPPHERTHTSSCLTSSPPPGSRAAPASASCRCPPPQGGRQDRPSTAARNWTSVGCASRQEGSTERALSRWWYMLKSAWLTFSPQKTPDVVNGAKRSSKHEAESARAGAKSANKPKESRADSERKDAKPGDKKRFQLC